MVAILIQLIQIIANLVTLLIIVNAVLSFVLQPDHPTREAMERVLRPVYAPIRRFVPPLGMIDLTPLVAILLIQVIEMLLISLLSSMR